MTVAAPGCGQPFLHDLPGQRGAGETGAEREDVGPVVLSAVPGRRQVVAGRGADARDLVGHHRRADAGAVDHDPADALAGRHLSGDGVGEVGVVTGLGAVGAAVLDRPAGLDEVGLECLLELEPAMVGPDRDALAPFDLRVRLYRRIDGGPRFVEHADEYALDQRSYLGLQLGSLHTHDSTYLVLPDHTYSSDDGVTSLRRCAFR